MPTDWVIWVKWITSRNMRSSRLHQEEPKNLNTQITTSEVEAVIELPIHISPGPDAFTGNFYQTFREELTPVLLKLSHKI